MSDFYCEEINMPIERYSCIESNFLTILDKDKLAKYFDPNSENDTDFERECIINMMMAVPSILIELDRIDDAISLIEQCSKIGLGLGTRGWMHGKLDLMKASLLINKKKDLVAKFDSIMYLLESAKAIFRDACVSEGIAEAFYLQGLLLTQLDKLQQHQISYMRHSKFLPHTQSLAYSDPASMDTLTQGTHSRTESNMPKRKETFDCVCYESHDKQDEDAFSLDLDDCIEHGSAP